MPRRSHQQFANRGSLPESGHSTGLTVIELLVVMAIASILMGMSISSFARVGRGPAIEVAEREVRSSLGRARMSARQQSALCQLTLVSEPVPAIRLMLARDAGSWQFSEANGSKVLGGRNNYATLSSAKLEDNGVVRSCVSFEGSGEVTCDSNPGYDPSYGFDIRFFVRPFDADSSGPLVSYGDAFQLELLGGGGLVATLDLEQAIPDKGRIETSTAVLAPGVWAEVGLFFDGTEFRITAHGVTEAQQTLSTEQIPGPVRLLPPDRRERLKFGGKGFRGSLDEIVYRTAEEEEVVPLATGRAIEFDMPTPLVIRFDSEGRLDPRLHTEAVEIAVKDGDDRRVVRVDLSGVIR
jgi:Tfp pilus assembly protein FimT